ncbi:hypothetical protein ACS0TY_034752 [Phlomoides rotata]
MFQSKQSLKEGVGQFTPVSGNPNNNCSGERPIRVSLSIFTCLYISSPCFDSFVFSSCHMPPTITLPPAKLKLKVWSVLLRSNVCVPLAKKDSGPTSALHPRDHSESAVAAPPPMRASL